MKREEKTRICAHTRTQTGHPINWSGENENENASRIQCVCVCIASEHISRSTCQLGFHHKRCIEWLNERMPKTMQKSTSSTSPFSIAISLQSQRQPKLRHSTNSIKSIYMDASKMYAKKSRTYPQIDTSNLSHIDMNGQT